MAASLVLAACGGAAFQALRLAWAEHLGSGADPRGWERAAALDPRNPEWHRRLAEYHDPASSPGAAQLRAATDRDPANASLRIALGLSAEMRGDLAAAERELLRAARLSRLYEPRWTLANFYFRRGRTEPFWNWARQALEISYGDRAPLFRLCWRMDPDGGGARLEQALPTQPDLRREYVRFLLAEKRLDPATSLARRMAATALAADRETLLAVGDAWLARGQPEPALSLWNGLCARQVLPYAPLDAVRGACLTNGRLTSPPVGAGFDWRLEAPRGATLLADTATGELRVALSGRQPEACRLFWQYVPVVPGSRYRLSFEYRTEQVAPGAGVYWSVRDADSGGELAASRDLSSDAWTGAWVEVTVPLASRLVRVGVFYQRRPGTVRSEGSIWFRQIALRLAP